jgi:hypothetical protein
VRKETNKNAIDVLDNSVNTEDDLQRIKTLYLSYFKFNVKISIHKTKAMIQLVGISPTYMHTIKN